MKYNLVFELKVPGVVNYAPMNGKGEYIKSTHGFIETGRYSEEYLPKKKALVVTIADIFADPMATHRAINTVYSRLLKVIRQYKQSGNEYLVLSWLSEWFTMYNKALSQAAKVPHVYKKAKESATEFVNSGKRVWKFGKTEYQNDADTCHLTIWYEAAEAETEEEANWLAI